MSFVVFIIPGFKDSPNKSEYNKVGRLFQEKGIKTIFIAIPWNRTIISENVDYFLKEFNKVKADKKYVLGFSFGAVIVFIASTRELFDGQILCSLSPYFQEDLPTLKKSWIDGIGKRRLEDFKHLNNKILSKKVKTNTILLYGTRESNVMEKRAKDTFKNLSSKKSLIPIEGARHNIGDLKYLNEIQKALITIE